MIKKIYEEDGRLKCDGCFYTGIEDDGIPPKPRVGSWVKFKEKNCYAVVIDDHPKGIYQITYLEGKNEFQEDTVPRFCTVLVGESGIELVAPWFRGFE